MQTAGDKKIAIVCNVLAGAGRACLLAEKISIQLANKNIVYEIFKENWPADFNYFTDIFIVGGDGTLNYFINYYPDIALPLVIFNGGTGNDFHWLLYANKTLDQQMQVALNESPKPIDIGRCNGRYFINGVGIGFEGAVAKALTGKKKLSGKTSFLSTVLKKILTYRSKNYRIQSSNEARQGKQLLVDISNGARAGGGFHIAPQARVDDGLLDVIIVKSINPLQRLWYLPVIEKGKHLKISIVRHYLTRKISIESDRVIQYHLDGEYFEDQQLVIEVLPAKLNFRYSFQIPVPL
jgi:YegS/Rv2252/BmrU family lipid kinase